MKNSSHLWTGEIEAMIAFWDEWERVFGFVDCIECGLELDFSPAHCAHVLSKQAYPKLRRFEMVPMCLTHHTQYDQGEAASMCSYRWLRQKRDKLIREYYR